jgi:thiosulfate/3-mercaptopyruvate sulfurtransferase
MSSALLPLLLEPEEFQQQRVQLQDLLLVDVSSPDNYRAGHIPGALHVPPAALLRGTPPAPGKIPEPAQLQQLLSWLGLTPQTHVVAYDDEGGGWAGRLLWTLEAVGHANYSYLNGGIHAWRAAGFEVESNGNEPVSSDYQVHINQQPIAEVEDILPRLAEDGFEIWDARSAEEYHGLRSGSARAGHIPGAINIDWLELIDRQRDTRLVDLAQLQLRLNELGLSADKDIVTHCQSHHRSGLSWLVMKILGYPSVKGFHGSWGEWGNREDTPVEAN